MDGYFTDPERNLGLQPIEYPCHPSVSKHVLEPTVAVRCDHICLQNYNSSFVEVAACVQPFFFFLKSW